MKKKIFVIDTSVILYDNQSVFSFEEHRIAIPITVLEELDGLKKGNQNKNFQAREFIRFLDGFSSQNLSSRWLPMKPLSKGKIKIVCYNSLKNLNDNKIIDITIQLQKKYPNDEVVLVSKDINQRVKARALKIRSEDYKKGKVSRDLYKGVRKVKCSNPKLINNINARGKESKFKKTVKSPQNNEFFLLEYNNQSSLAYYNPYSGDLQKVSKKTAVGIKPRNAGQTFAMHALLNDSIKLVTLEGPAGTGKTLIALAAALEQQSQFDKIFVSRPLVPLNNKDIGYLPGNEKEKINPYMMPLWDNLDFIKSNFSAKSKMNAKLDDIVKSEKIMITPLAFIRGRSFVNKLLIIDEAQNLTPLEVKTIITRAGENTKIILTGDRKQIDTPYLDEFSNGLSHLIDRFRGDKLYAHVHLEKGERSILANMAFERL